MVQAPAEPVEGSVRAASDHEVPTERASKSAELEDQT